MNTESIRARVLTAAAPYLEGRTVSDVVVGISLVGVQLSDGSVGISYVLRHGLPPYCSSFEYAADAVGRSAAEVAAWLTGGGDNIGRAIGNAVLTAASQALDIPDDDNKEHMFDMDFGAGDNVGMIGLISPVARALTPKVKEMIIFDESVSAFEADAMVCPMERQSELLPKCNKMIITGSSVINGSIDGLLEMCSGAQEIAMVGASTPMFPEGWRGTKVICLAGSWCRRENKDEIFRAISQGSGIKGLKPWLIQKAARV